MSSQIPMPQGSPALRLVIPPDAKFGPLLRSRVFEFATARSSSTADIDEFITAVFEAFANAVKHSHSQDVIEVCCWYVDHDRLLASVVDQGIGFDAQVHSEPRLPDPLSEGGRGLPLMRRFTDDFEIRSEPGSGTVVTLGRRLGASDARAESQQKCKTVRGESDESKSTRSAAR